MNYILRKKKIPANESACKHKQRHDAFSCVVFAGTEGLACAADEKGKDKGKLGSSLSFF